MKYRKKPVVIEAVQWMGNLKEIEELFGNKPFGCSYNEKGSTIVIDTLEGQMMASMDDYIVKGIKGEFYPCKPDIFEMTYEKIV